MKINVSYLENEIELVSEYVVSIEIENKKYFYRLVHELYNIYQGIISSEVTFYDDSHNTCWDIYHFGSGGSWPLDMNQEKEM